MAETKERRVNVYFRCNGNLGKFKVDLQLKEDHTDAILSVKEALVADGEGFDLPVLAVIEGDKNVA